MIFTRIMAAVLGAGLIGMWFAWGWQVRQIEADRDRYKLLIEDPEKGYVRQVAQCLTNTAGIKEGFDRIAGDVDRLAKDTEARDKNLAQTVGAANKNAQKAFATASKALARPTVTLPGTLESCRAGEAILRGRVP